MVPGATVEAVDAATGVSHKTVTSSAGEYTFQDMPLGAYIVKVHWSRIQAVGGDERAGYGGSDLHPAGEALCRSIGRNG